MANPAVDPRSAPVLAELKPMLVSRADQPWADEAWIAEVLHDGYRLLADVRGSEVALRTGAGENATGWYPELAGGLAGLTPGRTVLDGEVTVFDAGGRSSLRLLHARSQHQRDYAGADRVTFLVFDILVADGVDVRPLPLRRRQEILEQLLAQAPRGIVLMPGMPGEAAPDLYRLAVEAQLKGIVMKRLDSPYAEGEPRGDWVAIRTPAPAPQHFGMRWPMPYRQAAPPRRRSRFHGRRRIRPASWSSAAT